VLVFKNHDFKFYLDANQIDNSYTAYENKIGLSSNSRLLKDIDDVVLNFPYKDCVLEGGQSTEEGTDEYFEYDEGNKKYEVYESQRKEIFFNEILAQDERDRLFEPKAFTNIQYFSSKGKEKLTSFNRNADGVITDNLIVKGNNLLALHSLKEQFSGKIKLIYIDPPYNTSGSTDTFSYNNNFKHSAWLTFIKNRLEISKELLLEDGFIAVTIDHVELFYIGSLLDEVFKRENRVGIVTILVNPKGRQHEKFFSASTEYMLVYAKNIKLAKFNKVTLDEKKTLTFNLTDKDGKYRLQPFARIRSSTKRSKKPDFWYPIYVSKDLSDISLIKKPHYNAIYPIVNGIEYTWKTIAKTFNDRNKDGFFVAVNEDEGIIIKHKYREQQVFKNLWIDKKYFPEFQGTNLLKKLLGANIFSYPKSLYAVQDTLKIMTKKNDIVLDFFAGSGTTAHAALNLANDSGTRQFILVEQLDYIEDVTVKRIQQVVKNNKKDSFIYFELKKWNEEAKEKILSCNSFKELKKLFIELADKYFLNYNVKIKEFQEVILGEKAFQELPIRKQQAMSIKMLDLNQLYVSASEMEDKKYGISKEEIDLTKDFYSLK
jgi:adenine-specific DNA-methyltransferase